MSVIEVVALTAEVGVDVAGSIGAHAALLSDVAVGMWVDKAPLILLLLSLSLLLPPPFPQETPKPTPA